MKHRLSFVVLSVALLLSACASMPTDDSSCRPPAYCGNQKTYDYHGAGQG
jgi:major membrane immunogen (membrane-anchored lipoprotein)